MKQLLLIIAFAVSFSIASSMAAETNIYRRVDGVIYNPKLSKLWKHLPISPTIPEFRCERYTVEHIRTNGVIFRVEHLHGDEGYIGDNDGWVFIKNCPNIDTLYDGQIIDAMSDKSFWALSIKNVQMPLKNGGYVTMRAFDCGEPCPPPKTP